MKMIRFAALALWFSLGLAQQSLFAQAVAPPHAPEIHAVLLSGNELSADLKFMCELAGPQGVRGWNLLESFLAEIYSGTDTAKPAVFDVLLTPTGTDVRAYFPLQVVPGKPLGEKFLRNIDGIGIKSKKLVANFYQLGGGDKEIAGSAFNGFLRILAAPANYSAIAKKRAAVPPNLVDPTAGKVVAALLAKKFDVGIMLENPKKDAASIKARVTDFQKVKDELNAGVKQAADELPEAFAVQKAFLDHNLGELSRFISESSELTLSWTTDAPKKEARLDLELEAIPDTDLDVSAKLLGQSPGMFSGVPRNNDAILSGRIHFPLDGFRKSNLLGAMPLFRASVEAQIANSKDYTDEQKAARNLAWKAWFDMLTEGVNQGGVDGLIEVSQANGEKANLVFALKAKDGNAVKGILEQLPKINDGYKVQWDVEKLGDYAIHTLAIPGSNEDMELLFGKNISVHVATGPQAWWVAIGSKSLDPLKKAITESAQPNAALANNFLTLFYRVGPWLELLDAQRVRLDAKPSDVKLSDAELKDKKERAAHRKLALDALKEGKDTIETKMDAKNGRVTGSTRFDEGLLKFIGTEVADFSNKTLK